MFTILTQAFRRTAQNWKIVLLIFLVNFILGLVIAFPAFNILKSESHNSLAFNNLITDFDFTVFSDFLRISGKPLKPLLPISLILTLIYIVLNVFFSGGILSQFTIRDTFRIKDFLQNSAHYFGKFSLLFLIQVIFIVIVLIISIIAFGVFGIIADGNTEPKFVAWMMIPLTILVVLFTYSLNIGDYAKALMLRDSLLNSWNAFWKASFYIIKNPKTMLIYWAILLAAAILILFYLWLESKIGMTSGFKIWLMFLIQQLFIFCRIFVRTWNLSNAFDYLSLRPVPITVKPVIVVETVEEETTNQIIDKEEEGENKLSE